MADYAIEVTNLHKSFKLPTEKAGKLKTAIVNLGKGIRGYKQQKVLKGLNFKVEKGEFFGIVGRNGSGKSTLLKIISKIYQPTSGEIKVDGRLVPFIELGVGFNPELTGRENVYLNGALLGFSNQEIDNLYDDIVGFAELHEFMDQKLKNYSSGMQVRLAFSLAIRAESDILVLDEVLAVGDEAFQRKCNEYFIKLKKEKKTVILVTHNMNAVQQFCDKAMMIKDGKITAIGKPDTVANSYTEENFRTNRASIKKDETEEYETGLSSLVPMFRVKPVSKTVLSSSDEMVFDIEYEITEDKSAIIAFSILDEQSNRSIIDNQSAPIHGKGIHNIRYSLPLINFNNINLYVTAILYDVAQYSDRKKIYDKSIMRYAFTNDFGLARFAIRNKDKAKFAILRRDSKIIGKFIIGSAYQDAVGSKNKE